MSVFVKQYQTDANEAKRQYYMAKLDMDVAQPKGKKDLQRLLYRYLEGMQWVLFYYYKGAQHWRWYYPYHYAPMISDLGTDIVDYFLDGQKTITHFRTDTNCSANPKPYTPFQQLLCIFPVKSLRQFLPAGYSEIAEGSLKEFFPDDFDIDLNGRTLPWEACILIPFADEELFLEQEKRLFDRGMQLSKEDWKRNTCSFSFEAYWYDHTQDTMDFDKRKPLVSSLRQMNDLKHDCSAMEMRHEYEKCGQFCFDSKQLPGVIYPQPDFPSMQWLNVTSLKVTEKFINKVRFESLCASVPATLEDQSGGDFEDWIYNFAESKAAEIFVNFPR